MAIVICPHCGSTNVALTSVKKSAWQCRDCGKKWISTWKLNEGRI